MTTTPLLWHEHNETRWTGRPGGMHCDTYAVAADLYVEGEWACQWRETAVSIWVDIGRGGKRQEAMAVATAHHAARVRRLAWERYMKENDPPPADLETRIGALENPPCCEGGPQWGHAWTCPKCPD